MVMTKELYLYVQKGLALFFDEITCTSLCSYFSVNKMWKMFLLPENFQWNDFAGLVFESVCVEKSSNISIAYLISVDYIKFWLTFKEIKHVKPYKYLQEWFLYPKIEGSFWCIYIWIENEVKHFFNYSYECKYEGKNLNYPYLLLHTTDNNICSHLCYSNVNITMFHSIKTPYTFSMSSSKKTWALPI